MRPSKDGCIMIIGGLISVYLVVAGLVQTIDWIREVIA